MEIAETMLILDSREEGKTFNGFHPEVAEILTSRRWPGNVRQLLNVIRNIVVLHDGPIVLPHMLPHEVQAGNGITPSSHLATDASVRDARADPLGARRLVTPLVGTSLAEVERELIEATIEHCDGSIPKAARLLAVSPSTIYRKRESWSGSGPSEA
jgi:two-component system, repressor protein LuxO